MAPLRVQLSDFVSFILLPLLSAVLPAAWSRRLVARVSGWPWILQPIADLACEKAGRFVPVPDPDAWRQRWRQVELLDHRDAVCMALGRRRALLDEVDGAEQLDGLGSCVLVGMHWGPQFSILRLLANRGLRPSLLYRDADRALLRTRPLRYLYQRIVVREMVASCAGRAVRVGGASGTLRQRLSEEGVEIVVVDAPPYPGRSVLEVEVLGRRARFNAGFPALLLASGKPCAFFSIALRDDGSLRKRLFLTPPRHFESEAAFLAAYCRLLDEHLLGDAPQWRIWQAADQMFPAQGAGEADRMCPEERAGAADQTFPGDGAGKANDGSP